MADATLAGPARFTFATLPLLPSADRAPAPDVAQFVMQTWPVDVTPDAPPCLDVLAFQFAVGDSDQDPPTTSDDSWLYP